MSKVKLLYITNSLNANSETFIQNTIGQIRSLKSVDLKLYTLEISDFYLYQNHLLLNVHRILKKFRFNRFRFKLLDYLIKVDYDVVFIDFGNNAVDFNDYFYSRQKRMIVHLHGFDISKLLNSKHYLNWLIQFTVENKVIVPSIYNSNRLEILGCKKANIHVIPYSFYGGQIVNRVIDYDLIFVGRFVSKKDPRILIYVLNELVKTFPNIKLCMVGSGYLYSEVSNLIRGFNLNKNVELKGLLSHSEVFDLLVKSKIYIQHSVTSADGDQEGFPNSILEASSLGLPVVSTIHAGIPEIVLDGVSGFLVQEFDYLMMAKKISELLNDDELRKILGDSGQKYILEKCNPSRRIDAIEKLIIKNV